jgi:plastocyanin
MNIDLATIGDARMNRRLVMGALAASAMIPVVGTARAQTKPTLAVVTPADGAKITANDIAVQVNVRDLKLDCAAFGRPDQPGVGEVLAFVDGATIAQLTNFYCTDAFSIAGEGLTPGKHTLAFALASNTHVPMMDTVKQVTIDFAPPAPTPLPAAHFTGAPGVKLDRPRDGATVPAVFRVNVTPENFTPQAGLEGKTNVAGFGHYHVWVDAPAKPSSLANLVLMPGANEFTLDLSAWGPGKHTIRIEPAQNDHTMYDPSTPAEFTVNVSESATPATGATQAAASPAAAAPLTIHMTSALRFDPTDATVGVGQTVTWVNDGPIQHTATDDPAKNPVAQAHPDYAQLPDGAAAWDSGLLDPGKTFSHTFTVPGIYHYFCIPHVLSGMRGTIMVQG